jgi:hypothetical protein
MLPDEIIMDKIYLIRGQKVMLDHDLDALYEDETRRLNEQNGTRTVSLKTLCFSLPMKNSKT